MNLAENGFVVEPRLENIFIFGLNGTVKASEGKSSYHNETKVHVCKGIVLCFSEVKVYANQHDFISDTQTSISFVFSSWIINEFHKSKYMYEILFL
jgi:hypothetical protein